MVINLFIRSVQRWSNISDQWFQSVKNCRKLMLSKGWKCYFRDPIFQNLPEEHAHGLPNSLGARDYPPPPPPPMNLTLRRHCNACGNVVSRLVVPCSPLTCLFTTWTYFRNFWTGGMIHLRKLFSYYSYKSAYGQTELNRSILS